MKTVPALFACLVLVASATAQRPAPDFQSFNPRFEAFTFPDELGVNSVQGMVQDNAGFLWFGTSAGLLRYDGQKFVTYRHEPDNPNSLGDDFIFNIFLDSKGVLWITYESGSTAFDPALEKFTRYAVNGWEVAEDRAGYIWFGGWGGLHRLDRKTGKVKHFQPDSNNPRSLSSDFVYALYVDKAGVLWAGMHYQFGNKKTGGLYRYDPKTESFTRYVHDPNNPQSLDNNTVRSIFEDSRGNFWVGTYGDGLHLMNREKGTFTRLVYDPKNPDKPSRPWLRGRLPSSYSSETGVFSITEDRDGRIWIAANEGGLNVYDPATNKTRHFEYMPGEGNLSTNNLRRVFHLADGTTWLISTDRATVFKVKDQGRHFPFFRPDGCSNDDRVSDAVKDRDGNVWLSYSNKPNSPLIRYDRKTGKSFPVSSAGSGLNVREVYSLEADPRGFLWLGTEKEMFQYNLQTGKFRHFPNPLALSPFINWIMRDSKGYIWVFPYGLNRLDPNTGKFTTYWNNPADSTSISGNTAVGLFEDSKGNFWVGGHEAEQIFLDRFNPMITGANGQTSFTHFGQGIKEGAPHSICEDNQGNIWFLNPEGIFKFNPTDRTLHKLDLTGSNLHPFSLIDMVKAKNGRFWINANGGFIYELDPESGRLAAFGKDQGIPGSELRERSKIFVADDGEVLMGRSGGFIAFYPDSLFQEEDKRPPLVRITDFWLMDERVTPGKEGILKKPVWQTDYLCLRHDQNIFSFGVACFDFHNPTANQIQFMLEGFDPDWRTDVLNGQTPPYMHLSPGDYTFRVRGASSSGAWNMEGASLRITILPPWWKTWWAYTIYGLVFFGFLFRIRQLELKKQRQKLEQAQKINEQLRRLDTLKDQFLANTSHELRTPLQGIIGLSEHLYDEAEHLSPDEFRENLAMTIASGKRLNSLVNDILDFSKLKNADLALQLRPVSLYAMADVVLKNLAPLVAGKDLVLQNDVPPDLSAEADENRLQQILFNLVGNAVKFTETGQIKISAAPQNGMLEVAVEDTGTGIPADKQEAVFQEFVQGDASATRQFTGTGLGLSVSKKLVELHGGTMRLVSEVGKGSTFFFTLPLAQGAATPSAGNAAPVSSLRKEGFENLNLPATPLPTPVSGTENVIQILVVDDEPVNQQVLKNHLSATHYHITPALNGEEALRALESSQTFDLVLLDVMMPRMSGYEVCEKIREKYLPSELPVIMITAKNQVQDLVQGLNTGANDYLAKPFSKEEFLARVKTQLNLHRINEATGKFVPNEFLRALGRDSITEALLGDHTEREVTVLFSDIRDYTALSENMSPEENFNFVNAFNKRMGPIIRQHKGFINQYLGDGIMAIFPGSPADALAAAVAMQRELARYNEQRLSKDRQPIRLGIGLHTGDLVMGIIGDERRLDAATIADTVNTASRLESLSKFYGANILLSQNSLNKIADATAFHVRYLGKVQVKGKKEPIKVYECFDGDAPAVFDQKQATLSSFEDGLKYYLGREFAKATVSFEAVLKQNQADATARFFLNKSAHFMDTEVPEDWNGVEMMEGK